MADAVSDAAEVHLELMQASAIIVEHMDAVEAAMEGNEEARIVLREKSALTQWLAKGEEIQFKLNEIKPLLMPEAAALVTLKADVLSCVKTIIKLRAKITECDFYITQKGVHPQPGLHAGGANYDVKQLSKIELSEYDGNPLKYKKWSKETQDLLAGDMLDAIRVKRIVDCLTGDAKLYVGDAGNHLESSALLWAYLDKRYKDDWQINLSVVGNLVNIIQKPLTTVGSIVQLPDTFHNCVTAIEARGLSIDQLLQTIMFAIMPIDIKNEVINRVRVIYPDNKSFTWDEVSASIYQINSDFDLKYNRTDPLDMIAFGNKSIVSPRCPPPRHINRHVNKDKQKFKDSNKDPKRDTTNKAVTKICLFCLRDHDADQCENVLTKAERIKLLKSAYRCTECTLVHEKADSCNPKLCADSKCNCKLPSHFCKSKLKK